MVWNLPLFLFSFILLFYLRCKPLFLLDLPLLFASRHANKRQIWPNFFPTRIQRTGGTEEKTNHRITTYINYMAYVQFARNTKLRRQTNGKKQGETKKITRFCHPPSEIRLTSADTNRDKETYEKNTSGRERELVNSREGVWGKKR